MHGTRLIICDCGSASDPEELRAGLSACGAHVTHEFRLIPGVAVGMAPDALKEFFARYPTATVIPDRRRQIPPKPFGPDEWAQAAGPADRLPTSPTKPHVSPLAVSLTRADGVHALGFDGSDVRVCIVDSGIDFGHPDLAGTEILGKDGKPLASDFTETDLTDTIGHGTAVAGCIAAQARQVYTITDEQSGQPIAYTRIKGMAPGVKLMSAKVFDTRVASGYDSTIIAALEWAVENGAQIINMSLGGQALPNDGRDPLAAAVAALRERGILVVVAAGNEGSGFGTLQSPGSSPGALTVGASTMYRSFSEMGFLAEPDMWTADQLASFSSQGPSTDGRLKPEILAPGAFDWGLAPAAGSEEGKNFQLFGGTSQAAPLMTGAAALVYQGFQHARGRYPTPDELIQMICSTADDLGLPAHMQGAGRVNCLRAAQVVSGKAQSVTVPVPQPTVVAAGAESTLPLEITNLGNEPATFPVSANLFDPLHNLSSAFNGQIATAESPQEISFDVAPDTDLMQVALSWPAVTQGPEAPRLLIALYDPQGRFVNYQRPNTSGDLELARSVDTWVARPQPGRWKARIVLRLGVRETLLHFTLAIRAFRRANWDWVSPEAESISLAPGETKSLQVAVRVPTGTPSGTHVGHLMVGATPVPLSVVVPISLEKGQGAFAGSFQHGYQGSWGNGDWLAHDLPVPDGTRSLIASVQWPDIDNAVEFYLIDPAGTAVMGRSNNDDILETGNSTELGNQILLAHPEAGTWRLIIHSFAFCGRGMPEPYFGLVETCGELVSPRTIQMRVQPGERAPLALSVRNPGRMPLQVSTLVQTLEPKLVWQNITGEVKSGVTADGKAEGDGQATLATIDVPYGAKQFGVTLTWDQPNTSVALSLFDPVAQSSRETLTSDQGTVMVTEPNPVPGKWTVMAGVTNPGIDHQTVALKGAVFVVAPQPLEGVTAKTITVQPGGHEVLPLTVLLPEGQESLMGRIVVTTSRGDRLGEVDFRIQASDQGGSEAEVAAGKE